MIARFVGGPLDGQEREIPAGLSAVVLPTVRFEPHPSGRVRRLDELEPEIRFDPETFAIIAPSDLVPIHEQIRYVPRNGEWHLEDES